MALPLRPPLLPQLAKSQKSLPEGDGWVYEPKWDGFRSIAFVDGGEVHLQSRNGKPLTRYFPELQFPEGRYVLDGEIVLFDEQGAPGLRRARPAHPPGEVAHRHAGRGDADALHRLRPARGRRRDAARACPSASAATGSSSWSRRPSTSRPASEDPAEAQPWLQGAEGVIAKRQDAPYRPGERVGMVKIKRVRTIDAVVRGWRPGKEEGTLGSLSLGLYDDDGQPARGRPHAPASPPSRSASCRPSSPPTRPASASAPSRAAGTPRARWTAPSSGPSWSSK